MTLRIAKLPKPDRGQTDRRIERSTDTATALELALTSAANRAHLDAVLLVDDAGMLVSKSNTALDLSMLAAVTPIVGRGKAIPRIKRNGEKRELSVKTLEIEGELLYMAALGGSNTSRQRELRHSVAAAERIFAA
ncbi:MAG: hypothetical protein AAGA54_16125 [Myxococcota bacterium]